MALRLRRGTDAERQLITPLEGELIYTTDTKKVFVGDGITPGGNAVDTDTDTDTQIDIIAALGRASINDLGDVATDSAMPNDGDVLQYDSASGDWFARPFTIAPNSPFNVNVVDNDGNVIVNSLSGELTGDLTGSVFADDSTLIIDGQRGFVTGTLKGNVLNKNTEFVIIDTLTGDMNDASGIQLIDAAQRAFLGDQDGNMRGSVFNSTLSRALVDHINETFNGTLIGDVRGSVFADDSTTIVDGNNATINAVALTVDDIDVGNTINFQEALGESISFKIARGTPAAPITPNNFDRTGFKWTYYDNGTQTFKDSSLIFGYHQTSGAGYMAITPADSGGNLFNTAVELDGDTGIISLNGNSIKMVLSNIPASSIGAAGDTAGMISVDDNYLYRCTANFDGVTDIWTRIAWTGGTW